jgi:hypothetical protein
MGFAPPRKPPSFLLPPLHRGAEQDRFGLPTQVPSLLSETTQERHDRIADIEQLIADAFDTAARHLGKKESRKLFEKVTKDYSKRGKQPNRHKNNLLLSKFYELAHEHPEKKPNAIATKVAEWCEKERSFPIVERRSLIRRINRLVLNRKRPHQEPMHAGCVPPSLLGSEQD